MLILSVITKILFHQPVIRNPSYLHKCYISFLLQQASRFTMSRIKPIDWFGGQTVMKIS